MADRSTLSRRGERLAANPPFPEYLHEHFARSVDRWHPEDNSDGYVGMCVAENKLLNDLMLDRLADVGPPPGRALGYDDMAGNVEFRERLGRFMGSRFLGRVFPPEHVLVLSGAGTVLESLFHVIGDPGDAVLVPTPSYAGFWADLEARDGLQIVPVPCLSANDFRLSVDALEAAYRTSTRPVRALLYTHPSNPLGRVAPRDELEAVLSWAESHELHVVFDEIYALSVFGDTPFVSAASLRPSLGERVHIVWAFSKDFGVSGLRCGVLVTENEAVARAVDAIAYWGCVSGLSQWVLGEMIQDVAWVDHYLIELRRRLGDAYAAVASSLGEVGIPHVTADAGIFVVCDFREFLDEATWEAEDRLWRRLLEVANVNLTPGAACRNAEPGFLRLCFATGPTAGVAAGIERIGALRS
jgi:aspartate/methionine/tyrosine aminotransferase